MRSRVVEAFSPVVYVQVLAARRAHQLVNRAFAIAFFNNASIASELPSVGLGLTVTDDAVKRTAHDGPGGRIEQDRWS
jgi:hypothetical protein